MLHAVKSIVPSGPPLWIEIPSQRLNADRICLAFLPTVQLSFPAVFAAIVVGSLQLFPEPINHRLDANRPHNLFHCPIVGWRGRTLVNYSD